MAILSGRIVFKLEDREIELAAGDTLVQGGNLHTWINRWDEPCLLLFVVVTGEKSA
jgi:quercetin dioxygenase-like cupin family protein